MAHVEGALGVPKSTVQLLLRVMLYLAAFSLALSTLI